ncbi:Oligopeptide transporter 5 [Acorus calamus]|uniref:Oligopeptide transporter 5 n=1 Tax=Acorus calamus TaxID=4465 RepID=A0AAV9CV87_ACOCL|nr:Oligopeptide transporter 5 [Acorus calamus]
MGSDQKLKHEESSSMEGGGEVNDSPVEEVRITVPITDDPTHPVLTFRTWTLGISSCIILSFVNQFFNYRQNFLSISSTCAQIIVLPIGRLMAATLPTRTLHETEVRRKGGLTRLQFFLTALIASFAYYTVPGFFFPSISYISIACLIWKRSIIAQQIGSGFRGLGLGSFTLDWSTITALGSPLATPAFAIINIMVGFFAILYVLLPIAYWTNAYHAKRFPIISAHVFDSDGNPFNITRVLDQKSFTLNMEEYNSYSKINLSIFFAYTYGLGFAALAATISHVILFNGRTIWSLWRKTASAEKEMNDVHNRIMKKNYKQVPQWWFHIILVLMMGVSLLACEGFGKQLQLPYWGLFLAFGMAVLFTLPVGVIKATTNQAPGLNIITELVIGFLYPGRPLANVAFKTYGYISMDQAITFLTDFKLGHYMKVPPRSMFVVQLVGTVIANTAYFLTAWWLLETVPDICNPALLPKGSPWTCPSDEVFYNASIIWGLVVWLLARAYPQKKWIKLINMPVIIGATMSMPPARSLNYLSWISVGLFFNMYVYRRHKGWWARSNYVMSAALDAGVSFMAVILYFALQHSDINGLQWWGADTTDHCELASCPTEPGILQEGCPIVH